MNIQDLSIILAAIELAIKRGTFSIFEVGTVGQATEKLAAFLKEANDQAEAAKAAEADAAVTTDAEATDGEATADDGQADA